MEVWYFILMALAVWRVSNMLADTDQSGPWSLLDKIRSKAGVTFDENSNKVVKVGGLADMLTCVYCNSIYIGFVFVAGYILIPIPTIIVSAVLSLSAISIFIQETINAIKA